MAGQFHVVQYSAPSVKVYPGNLVQPTIRAWCLTVPTGIGFAYEVPEASFNSDAGSALLDVPGQEIEILVASHHVTGGQGVQDIDANNLLTDFVDLVVTYTVAGSPFPSPTAVAHVPMDSFFSAETGIGGLIIPGLGPSPQEIVDATYNHLVHLVTG